MCSLIEQGERRLRKSSGNYEFQESSMAKAVYGGID